VFDGDQDGSAVVGDGAGELDELRDPAGACRSDPPVQGLGCVGEVELEDRPEAFLELVGAKQPGGRSGRSRSAGPFVSRSGSPGSSITRSATWSGSSPAGGPAPGHRRPPAVDLGRGRWRGRSGGSRARPRSAPPRGHRWPTSPRGTGRPPRPRSGSSRRPRRRCRGRCRRSRG
jgi:hypothetical protein